nr:GNAT family protein [Algoriphagus terrigena]
MELLPISRTVDENPRFMADASAAPICQMMEDYYEKIGFSPPWIGYFSFEEGELTGTGGFKGQPVNGAVEIAYGTFEPFRQRGVGAAICRQLVLLAQKSDPSVKITARTLPENNFSTKILEKNGFEFSGTVQDPDDGEVWEWVYRKQ